MSQTGLSTTTPPKLPTITDLYEDKELALKESQLAVILNSPPSPAWIKQHPIYKTDYLPIERVEWLMTRIFGRWRVEILDTKLMVNSVVVTVRVHYRDPLTGEWEWMDGIGAKELQMNSGSNPTDITQIKGTALVLACPIAETSAQKDACEKLGKIFGKDLNRKDNLDYSDVSAKFAKDDKYAALLNEGGKGE